MYACSECNHGFSDKAFACPGCGRMVHGRGWWAVTIGWKIIMSMVISICLWLALFLLSASA